MLSIFVCPQRYETRNQLQKEKWGKIKHMETKQHTTKKRKKRKQGVSEEIKEEIRRYLETNENRNTTLPKSLRCNKNCSKRKVYSGKVLTQKATTSNNLTYHLKELEIIKIREEV